MIVYRSARLFWMGVPVSAQRAYAESASTAAEQIRTELLAELSEAGHGASIVLWDRSSAQALDLI